MRWSPSLPVNAAILVHSQSKILRKHYARFTCSSSRANRRPNDRRRSDRNVRRCRGTAHLEVHSGQIDRSMELGAQPGSNVTFIGLSDSPTNLGIYGPNPTVLGIDPATGKTSGRMLAPEG